MPPFLSKVLASPAVRKAALALLLAVLAAAGFSLSGCAALPEARQARVDLFECRVDALRPAVEPVFDASELVRDIYAGRADLRRVFLLLESAQDEVEAALERLGACDPAPQLPTSVEPR